MPWSITCCPASGHEPVQDRPEADATSLAEVSRSVAVHDMSRTPGPEEPGAPAPRLRIGLTGGIGSGKSAVAAILGTLGAAIVDADVIAHRLTAPGGAAMPSLVDAFGPEVRDANGALDRTAMRARAFADPLVRRRLEAILHPLIAAAMHEDAARSPGAYVVLVVPLLVENLPRWRDAVDRICAVDCTEDVQIERVRARSGLDADAVRAILAVQASRTQRLAVADDRIDNDGDLPALRAQVEALHRRYLELADRKLSSTPG